MSRYELSVEDAIPKEERLEMERANVRILLHCERAEADVDFGPKINPARYMVDVEKKTFDFIEAKTTKPRYSSEMEVAGTYNPEDETWLWPWLNPSADKACAQVKQTCESMPELTSIVTERKFTVSLRDADLLARWITLRMGWMGTFAAEYPEQPIAFVALKELKPKNTANHCVCCFGNDVEHELSVAALVGELGICNHCAEVNKDILAMNAEFDLKITYEEHVKALRNPEKKAAKKTVPSGMALPCVGCGSTEGLVMAPHAAVCFLCILDAIDKHVAEGKM